MDFQPTSKTHNGLNQITFLKTVDKKPSTWTMSSDFLLLHWTYQLPSISYVFWNSQQNNCWIGSLNHNWIQISNQLRILGWLVGFSVSSFENHTTTLVSEQVEYTTEGRVSQIHQSSSAFVARKTRLGSNISFFRAYISYHVTVKNAKQKNF